MAPMFSENGENKASVTCGEEDLAACGGETVPDGRKHFQRLKTQVTTDIERKEGKLLDWMDSWEIFEMLEKRTSRADAKVSNITGYWTNKFRWAERLSIICKTLISYFQKTERDGCEP